MKKTVVILLAALAADGFASWGCETLEKSKFFGRMGERVEAPENTLRAYRFALDNGFPVEVDLFATSDGELVALNDENLKSKAKIDKHPNACSWKGELENVDMGAWKPASWMGNWKNKGITIPRIGEILQILPEATVNQFHFRDGSEKAFGLFRKALDAQSKVKEESVIVIARNAKARDFFPKAKFYLEIPSQACGMMLEEALAAKADGVVVEWDEKKLGKEVFDRCREKGIAVNILVGTDPKAALKALRMGASSVTSESAPFVFASASGYAAAAEIEFDEKNIVAHRGESEEAPENTMPAYIAAAKSGFAIELDLYMTLDGVIYCTHDQRVWRKGCNLPMYEWSTNLYWKGQLENADAGVWMGEKWKGTKYPRLEEVLPLVKEYGIWMILEIKDPRKSIIMPKVERIVKSFDFLGPHNIVLAGAGEYMKDYRAVASCLLRNGWLADDEKRDSFAHVRSIDKKRVGMYGPRWDNLLFTRELVAAAHAKGVKVSTWTVNDAGIALEALRRGIDYVLSDRPNALLREMRQAKAEAKKAILRDNAFSHGLSGRKPWTEKRFLNDPDEFQFAIVADRTGGERAGYFKKAIASLNLLRPEFVMSVGDLINGGGADEEVLRRQWKELNGFVGALDMPFFYVVGNHDIFTGFTGMTKARQNSIDLWKEQFGEKTYYNFMYKGCHFVCLDSMEDHDYYPPRSPGLTQKQLDWAAKEMLERRDARWTFIFLHKPLDFTSDRFLEFERKIAKLDYTIFCGDWHNHCTAERHGRKVYMIGTTGGGHSGSVADDLRYGHMDSVTWVTMTKDGPKVANLALGGIHGDTIQTCATTLGWIEAPLDYPSHLTKAARRRGKSRNSALNPQEVLKGPGYDWHFRHAVMLRQGKVFNAGIEKYKPGARRVMLLGDESASEKASEYKGCQIFDLGFKGDRTENVLWRIQEGALFGFDAHVVVVSVGRHNAKKNTVSEIDEAIDAIVANVREQIPAAEVVVVGR